MPSYVSADIIVRELQNLDKVLADADAYTGQRLAKIEQLEKLLQQPNISLEYKYDIYRQLYQEYEVFQFNKGWRCLIIVST